MDFRREAKKLTHTIQMNSSITDVSSSGPSWEVDPTYANILAGAGSIIVILMWMSPFREIWTSETSIYKTKSAEKVNTAFGFVAGAVQCTLWIMYMCDKLDTMAIPFLVNIFGATLNTSFVACYWYFSKGDQRKVLQAQIFALVPTIPFAIAVWVYEGENALVGYFAMTVNVLMLFGPLAAAGQVIKKRSNEGMILAQLVLIFLSSVVWFSYGLYIFDIPIMVPNGLGILFGILQITLYFWAARASRQIARSSVSDEVALT